MLRLIIGLSAVLIAVSAFLLARESGNDGGLPRGMTREDCFTELPPDPPLGLVTCSKRDPIRIAMTWDRQPGAANYRVSGQIHYYKYYCRNGPHFTSKGSPEFSEMLPANTTWFQFPEPEDESANFVSEYEFHVEAVDTNDHVLIKDGYALIGEPRPCPEAASSRALDGRPTGERSA